MRDKGGIQIGTGPLLVTSVASKSTWSEMNHKSSVGYRYEICFRPRQQTSVLFNGSTIGSFQLRKSTSHHSRITGRSKPQKLSN